MVAFMFKDTKILGLSRPTMRLVVRVVVSDHHIDMKVRVVAFMFTDTKIPGLSLPFSIKNL